MSLFDLYRDNTLYRDLPTQGGAGLNDIEKKMFTSLGIDPGQMTFVAARQSKGVRPNDNSAIKLFTYQGKEIILDRQVDGYEPYTRLDIQGPGTWIRTTLNENTLKRPFGYIDTRLFDDKGAVAEMLVTRTDTFATAQSLKAIGIEDLADQKANHSAGPALQRLHNGIVISITGRKPSPPGPSMDI